MMRIEQPAEQPGAVASASDLKLTLSHRQRQDRAWWASLTPRQKLRILLPNMPPPARYDQKTKCSFAGTHKWVLVEPGGWALQPPKCEDNPMCHSCRNRWRLSERKLRQKLKGNSGGNHQ